MTDYLAHPLFLGLLRLLGTKHLADSLKEVSQAAQLCGSTHRFQGDKEVP
jgi:hypothetical protein